MWWWLWGMNSNLHLLQRFIILVIAHWKGWDAVNCLNQSVHTQSGSEKWVWGAKPNLYPRATRKQVVVAILEPIHHSQPCLTIHYTYNERLDGLSWYEMAESVCTHSILMWNVGAWSQNFTTLVSNGKVWWRVGRVNSNLTLVWPFNILMMKDWKGWDAVNGLNQSENTQSVCEEWDWAKPNLYPLITQK